MYLVGLDLGQANDYTARCVVEQSGAILAERKLVEGSFARDLEPKLRGPVYDVVHLERERRISYPEVVDNIETLLAHPRILTEGYRLCMDNTGVGRPIGDMLTSGGVSSLERISITHGDTSRVDKETGAYHVAKSHLVNTFRSVLESGRIKIVPELPLAGALKNEMMEFQMKISAKGHTSFEAAREQIHDDLIMSVMLAIYIGEQIDTQQKVVDETLQDIRGRDVTEWDILNYGDEDGNS